MSAKDMFEKEQLKKQLEEKNKPQIFIDTQDTEERYAEGLYQDYLEEENKKIKEQLTTYQILHRDCKLDNLKNISKIEEMENQQKEFVKYLEDKIDICDGFLDTVKSDLINTPYRVISSKKTNITIRIKENEIAHKVYKEILQKYRSIIGCDKVE